ncbi:Uncharacterized protein pbN1_18910 [Aromatoleum bremense]|nr:Uncharacterized protein pbN1_18910 [Aromatoleum bremense]
MPKLPEGNSSPQQPSTHTYRLFNFLKNRYIAAARERIIRA